MIPMTNAELWAFNTLNNSLNLAQQELQRTIAARDAYVKLIEAKYNARFDPETGQFMAKDGDKPKAKTKGVKNEVAT